MPIARRNRACSVTQVQGNVIVVLELEADAVLQTTITTGKKRRSSFITMMSIRSSSSPSRSPQNRPPQIRDKESAPAKPGTQNLGLRTQKFPICRTPKQNVGAASTARKQKPAENPAPDSLKTAIASGISSAQPAGAALRRGPLPMPANARAMMEKLAGSGATRVTPPLT